jgi:hypothetical protein
MASVQEQRRGILLLAFASAVLRIYMPGTVVRMRLYPCQATPTPGVLALAPLFLPLK